MNSHGRSDTQLIELDAWMRPLSRTSR